MKIIAVEPKSSPVLNGGQSGPHKIQGIGAGFVPKTYDADVIDEVFDVENDSAIRTGREIAQSEGLLVVSAQVQPSSQPSRWPSVLRTRARKLWCCCPILANAT